MVHLIKSVYDVLGSFPELRSVQTHLGVCMHGDWKQEAFLTEFTQSFTETTSTRFQGHTHLEQKKDLQAFFQLNSSDSSMFGSMANMHCSLIFAQHTCLDIVKQHCSIIVSKQQRIYL